MKPVLLKGGRVVDPSQNHDAVADLLIVNGTVEALKKKLSAPDGADIVDCKGKVVALEVEGKAMSSHQLARFIGDCEQTAVSDVTFLIGGAYGLPPEVSRAADIQLSLSAMIIPHRLARVLLVEQIYRAFTILRNEPYSH